jgi:Zn-dependent protease
MEDNLLPKYPPTQKKKSGIRMLLSLLLYLGIGWLIFPNSMMLLAITSIVFVHEMGHLIAMRVFGYKDTSVLFIPFLGGLATGSKREISQYQSAIVILAGPLPGILAGSILLFSGSFSPEINWYGTVIILLNGLNLLPIYPLDGGQLLNRVFLDEEGWLSRLFLLLSSLLLAIVAIHFKLYPLLLFPILFLWQLRPDKLGAILEKEITARGINTDLDYEQLPDEDYWKLRSILIEFHPMCKNISPARDRYDDNEERVQQLVQSLLHRQLLQDLSGWGKLVIGIIWGIALLLTLQYAILN